MANRKRLMLLAMATGTGKAMSARRAVSGRTMPVIDQVQDNI